MWALFFVQDFICNLKAIDIGISFLYIVTHVMMMENANAKKNIQAPSVLAVLKTIMDQTACLAIVI